MDKDDLKSFYIAILLSALIVLGVNYFFPKPPAKTANAQTEVAVADAEVSASDISTVNSKLSTVNSKVALSLAQSVAVPYGQVLSNDEMEQLVNELFACSNVNYTPNGKPILAILPQLEIDRLLDPKSSRLLISSKFFTLHSSLFTFICTFAPAIENTGA